MMSSLSFMMSISLRFRRLVDVSRFRANIISKSDMNSLIKRSLARFCAENFVADLPLPAFIVDDTFIAAVVADGFRQHLILAFGAFVGLFLVLLVVGVCDLCTLRLRFPSLVLGVAQNSRPLLLDSGRTASASAAASTSAAATIATTASTAASGDASAARPRPR